MTWTGIARREHSREGLRYPSDMTDREWLLTAPFIPSAKSGGRPRTTDMREVVNALLYIAASGCSWRLLPKCFAPVSTVRRYFYAWRDTGLFDAINMVLVMNLREIEGREASPSGGVIDSQSVKTTESGGVCGYDAGKKVKGRKRHIVTDTCGYLIFILVHAADIQDRDGAVDVLKAIRYRFPWLRHVFADGGYAGDKQVSLTDPDARSMTSSGRGTGVVGYNVQTAVDTKHHLIVAHEVTNVGHDRTQLKPISEKAQTAIRCEKIITIADRGYFNGEQVLACENTGILPIIPKTMTSNAAKQGYFTGVSVISCVLGHNG